MGYFYFCDLEFEPSRSEVDLNPTSFKSKMASPYLKDYVSHWMDKIIYEATLMRGHNVRTLCGVEASGAQHSTFLLLVFFYKWERKNAWLIDACLLSSVASTCFICELIKLIKLFQGIHSCLSPVEIPDLNPPHAFKLPVVSVPHTFGCPVQRTLLALRIPRGHPWYGMGIFWNDPMTNNFCSLAQSLIFFISPKPCKLKKSRH